MADSSHLNDPVLAHARLELPLLREQMTVDEALHVIREQGIGERIIYFYVINDDERLVGVLPTRRLLTSSPDAVLADLIIRRVVALPKTATLLDACELFVMHKFFAFPVVDEKRRVVGIIDIGAFTEEVLDLGQPEQVDNMFETLGFHISQVREASPWNAFRYRFPWLLATIGSGTAGAVMAGIFEATLERAIIVAFFLALVLALAESVSIQSMSLTLQILRTSKPTLRWFGREMRREMSSALLLAAACGLVVFCIVGIWRGHFLSATVIAASVAGSVIIACFAGLIVPSLLHAAKLDPKIAAGPITLATTDVLTLLLYFSLAALFL